MVELIVVIAILGILAGVGTVAYSGYVKRANKAVDQQLVADIAYAIQLADYANPGLLGESGGVVVLTDSAAPQITLGGEENETFTSALKDAIPDLDNARLCYSGWNGALNSNTINTILSVVNSSGLQKLMKDGYSVGYAENADFMWTEVMDADSTLSGMLHYDEGELVYKAADSTVTTWDSGLSDLWNGEKSLWLLAGSELDGDGALGTAACMAATVARNYAFAEYVKNNYDVSAETIAALQSWENVLPTESDGHYYVADAVYSLADQEGWVDEDMMNLYISADTLDEVAVAEYFEFRASGATKEAQISEYRSFNPDLASATDDEVIKAMIREDMSFNCGYDYPDFQDILTLREAVQDYITPDDSGVSQLYVDGVGYQTLMQSLQCLTEDESYDYTADDYLESIAPYVTLAGKIADGQTDIDALGTALGDITPDADAKSVIVIVALPSGGFMYTPNDILGTN